MPIDTPDWVQTVGTQSRLVDFLPIGASSSQTFDMSSFNSYFAKLSVADASLPCRVNISHHATVLDPNTLEYDTATATNIGGLSQIFCYGPVLGGAVTFNNLTAASCGLILAGSGVQLSEWVIGHQNVTPRQLAASGSWTALALIPIPVADSGDAWTYVNGQAFVSAFANVQGNFFVQYIDQGGTLRSIPVIAIGAGGGTVSANVNIPKAGVSWVFQPSSTIASGSATIAVIPSANV